MGLTFEAGVQCYFEFLEFGRVRKFLLRGGYFVRAILPHPLLRVAGVFLPRPLLRCRGGVAEAGRARHFFDNAIGASTGGGISPESSHLTRNMGEETL